MDCNTMKKSIKLSVLRSFVLSSIILFVTVVNGDMSTYVEPFLGEVQPAFQNNSVTNLTVQLGVTAFLHCKVRNLRDRTISWIRVRDYHILTTGRLTYTNDARFQLLHNEGDDDWILQIKFVQKHDNGTYECQVSTGTGIISTFVNLEIVQPEALILGREEHHVERGSTISLVCIIDRSPKPPQYVFWYHNSRMLNYDSTRGGVKVVTEPGSKTHSRLTILDADINDTGNYTCNAPNTKPDVIHVYVQQGDKTAAIHKRKASKGVCVRWNLSLVLLGAVLAGILR